MYREKGVKQLKTVPAIVLLKGISISDVHNRTEGRERSKKEDRGPRKNLEESESR